MALNPPLGSSGQPLRVHGEHYILSRYGIEFEVKIDKIGKLYGKGSCILTTNRLVLMNTKGSNQDKLKAFDLPLALMYDDGFEQPIFGANYWRGKCKPL